MTRLVVGLGNPGPEYVATRHNLGFEVVEHLALHEGLLFHPGDRLDGHAGPDAFRFARSHVPDALLVQPLTFMNRSGDVVGPLVRLLGGDPSRLLVVVDDLDLDVGVLRIRKRGGHGGQNGMRSVIGALGTDRFPRLRLGIGRPETDAVRHVLGRFDDRERPLADEAVQRAADAAGRWLAGDDLDGLMSRFHSRQTPGADDPPLQQP